MNKQILLFTCLLAISSPALGQEGGDGSDNNTAPADTNTTAPADTNATAPAETTPAAKIDPKCDCLKQCISTKKLDLAPIVSAMETKVKSNPILNMIFGDEGSGSATDLPEFKGIKDACTFNGDPGLGSAKQCLSTMKGEISSFGNQAKQFVNEAIDTLTSSITPSFDMLINGLNECQASCSAEENLICPRGSFLAVDVTGEPDVSKVTEDISSKVAKINADLRKAKETAVQGTTGQSAGEAENKPANEE